MRKVALIIIILLTAAGVAGYYIVRARMKTDLAFNAKVSAITDKIGNIRKYADAFTEKVKKLSLDGKKSIKNTISGISSQQQSAAVEGVEIYLKHGSVIKGKLVRKFGNDYTVECDGREFNVSGAQVSGVKYITQRDAEWPYKNDIVIKRTNGVVCDGRIVGINDKEVTMSFEEGGGGMEMGIPRSGISYLLFAPVYTKETETTEKDLKELFPKMKIYKNGNVTIFTDSYEKTAKGYEKIVLTAYTNIYFNFFPLFKDRRPQYQNFLVIFDDYDAYADNTGMPWFILGFFDPTEKVLYLYNKFGEKIEKLVLDMLAEFTGEIDKYMDQVKKQYNVDGHEDIMIDGIAKDYKDRISKAFNFYKVSLTSETKGTLRHELAHEVFSNWGVQDIIISKPKVDKEKLKEKRKKFAEATKWEDKKKLMEEMIKIRRDEEFDIAVSGSWIGEGIATYCATEPIGSINEELLFSYQDAIRKKELNPIEFFTNFEKGSFVGVIPKAKYPLYAQSWAFINFLIARYPDQFIEYQKKMAGTVAGKGKDEKTALKDDLTLLLACLNKDLPTIEKEFGEYMSSYPKADDPFVKEYMEYYEIWRDLMEVYQASS